MPRQDKTYQLLCLPFLTAKLTGSRHILPACHVARAGTSREVATRSYLISVEISPQHRKPLVTWMQARQRSAGLSNRNDTRQYCLIDSGMIRNPFH